MGRVAQGSVDQSDVRPLPVSSDAVVALVMCCTGNAPASGAMTCGVHMRRSMTSVSSSMKQSRRRYVMPECHSSQGCSVRPRWLPMCTDTSKRFS